MNAAQLWLGGIHTAAAVVLAMELKVHLIDRPSQSCLAVRFILFLRYQIEKGLRAVKIDLTWLTSSGQVHRLLRLHTAQVPTQVHTSQCTSARYTSAQAAHCTVHTSAQAAQN